MYLPLKQKVTCSSDKLIKILEEAFTEEELKEIISYYEAMGGELFVRKIVFLTSKMMQVMENLEVPNVKKVSISSAHSVLLDEEMKIKEIGVLVGSAYLEAFSPDRNASIFKKATDFKNKAQNYLKGIAASQYTETEQRKVMDFESSSLGMRLSEAVGKSFSVGETGPDLELK